MPSDQQTTDSRTVVEESVSHYQVERLSDGTVRLQSGGSVVHAPTYYEALERYAQWRQEHIGDLPEHLRADKRNSIYHDCVNPELEDVIANDADWIRKSVIADVVENDNQMLSSSGAWLAYEREQSTDPELGRAVGVYRLWETVYSETWEADDD